MLLIAGTALLMLVVGHLADGDRGAPTGSRRAH